MNGGYRVTTIGDLTLLEAPPPRPAPDTANENLIGLALAGGILLGAVGMMLWDKWKK